MRMQVAADPVRRPPEEQEAWRAYRSELHRFVRTRVEDEAAAEDLVHDVLLRAYSQRDTLRDAGQLRPWLYRITRNALIDHYRKRRPTSALPDELADEGTSEADGAQRELARCIEPFVKALPSRYREALFLSEIEGVPQREVAERLGLSLSGAKSRVQRARKMLAGLLLDCCRVELDSRGGILDYEPRGRCEGCSGTAD
jgi:RNA polymerase sigma-70 factor, ECF subfamily